MARLFNMPKSVSHLTTLLCPAAQVYLPFLKQNLFPKSFSAIFQFVLNHYVDYL